MKLTKENCKAWATKLGYGLHYFGKVFMFCRFGVLSLLVAGAFVLLAPQGREVLLLLASAHLLSQILFGVAAIAWATTIWYWPRVMMSFKYSTWPPRPLGTPDEIDLQLKIARAIARWFPRILGITALLVLTYAMYKTLSLAKPNTPEYQAISNYAVILLIITIVFGIYVFGRRFFFKKIFSGREVWAFNEKGIVYEKLGDLAQTQTTLWALVLSVIATLILFVLFTVRSSNLIVAPYLGAATIMFAATSAWVVAGSIAGHVGQKLHLPVLTLLVIYTVFVSQYNDNHTVRVLHEKKQITSPTRIDTSVQDHFVQWLGKACDFDRTKQACHIYLVAAEGGGIRAAYWTASVLGKLQDDDSSFASHLYVISGVSGGSVGASVFDALVALNLKATGCQLEQDGKPVKSYQTCAQSMLSQDFLSPTVATMLYPDLVQRFLFWKVDYFDRGRTLEETWERAWHGIEPNAGQATEPGFDKYFDNLWRGQARQYRVPSLILNSTQVETGRRVIMSNLPINAEEFADAASLRKEFENVHPKQSPFPMALSTAANGSARFTYVSPAGRVADDFHIVDGGYFENSGSTSALEILTVISKYKALHPKEKIIPYVIHISNDPGLEKIYTQRCYAGNVHFGENGGNEIKYASETLSPILTLYHTRGARAIYATNMLAKSVIRDGGEFFHFGLTEQEKGQLPLGWSLSESATKLMNKQLEKVNLLGCQK